MDITKIKQAYVAMAKEFYDSMDLLHEHVAALNKSVESVDVKNKAINTYASFVATSRKVLELAENICDVELEKEAEVDSSLLN